MRTVEAIVLVGGLGTRLRAVVDDVPKPLAPVAGRPFLAWVLDRLARQGMKRVVLAAGYRAEMVREVIGTAWNGMGIEYSVEESPLGTGGAIRQAAALLSVDGAHVLNGDTFLEYDMSRMADATREAGASLGMALAKVEDTGRYGLVARQADGAITGFHEKTQGGSGYINAGCYYLSAETLARLPAGGAYSFEAAVLPGLAASGDIYGYTGTSRFIDIGVPEDYRRAQDLFSARP